MKEMEMNKTSASTISPHDDRVLQEVLVNALNEEICFNGKENDPNVRQLFSSETPLVGNGAFLPGLVNCKQTDDGTKKQTNNKVHTRKGNVYSERTECLDLFIRPDGLPVTFLLASGTAELRRQVKIGFDVNKDIWGCVVIILKELYCCVGQLYGER